MAAKAKSKRPSRKRQSPKARKSPRKSVRNASSLAAERRRLERAAKQAELEAAQFRREAAELRKREKREKKKRATAEKRRAARRTKAGKARERESKRKARSRTATTREIHEIGRLVRWGIYTPKKVKKRKGRRVYTKGQAAYARRRQRKFAPVIETGAFVPVKSAAERKAWRKAGQTVTAKGVFVPVTISPEGALPVIEKRKRRRGPLKGKPEIIVTTKREPGIRKKRVVHVAVSPDDLALQEGYLSRRFDRAFRGKPEGARVRFYVEGRFGSQRTFNRNQFGAFVATLAAYRPKGGSSLYSFRERVSLGVVEPSSSRYVQTSKEKARRRRRVLRERRAGIRK